MPTELAFAELRDLTYDGEAAKSIVCPIDAGDWYDR